MTDTSRQHVATAPEDLLSPAQLAERSGLDFLRAIMAGELAGPPIAGPMGMRLISVEDGEVVFEGTPAFPHYNPLGAVHGGWYGTLLDSCMACAVQTRLPAGTGYTTLEYKVNLLRPVFEETGPLRAIGQATHVGRRTGVAEGRIEGPDGRLFATGSTTCLVMPLK